MKKRFSILLLLSVAFLYFGCTSTHEITEIRKRAVVPSVIEDTLPAELTDTVFVAMEVVKNDTVKYIEFRPDSSLITKLNELKKEKRFLGNELKSLGDFYFKIKPDTIEVWDTLKTVEIVENKIETPLLSKIGLVFVGVAIAFIILVLVKIKL